MPSFDETGPTGLSSLAGRRRGYCRDGITSRRAFWGAQPIRRDSGIGGYGRGYRWQYLETGQPRWARSLPTTTPSLKEERATLQTILEREAATLEEQLNDLKARLESLKLEERDDGDEVNGDATLERSQL
ncbi:MAG: DUF5320 domain-containing protein [Halobacteriota archaeon]